MSVLHLQPSRELDAQVGLHLFGITYMLLYGDYLVQDPDDSIAYDSCPRYSTDMAAAFLIEEELQRRQLHESYAARLLDLLFETRAWKILTRGPEDADLFAIAHAPPVYRCVAALQTLEHAATQP